MNERQLRLFPAPRPLLDRFGAQFFRRVPPRPGVYLLSGDDGRLLYVGKAANLRRRLYNYKNAQPGRVSRKVIRLVHETRAITWELCANPTAALLRENELLRLHQPKFNVLNTRPEFYWFITLLAGPAEIRLRLTRSPARAPGEEVWGAFKGGARTGYAALLRLLWGLEHRPASLYDLPSRLLGTRPPSAFSLPWTRTDAALLLAALRALLAGTSDELLATLDTALAADATTPPSLKRLHEADLETLTTFYRIGPKRNHHLRQRFPDDSAVIAPAELDDLLALAADG